MNILVLGGAGFVGRHLCAALVAADHHVTAFDLPPANGSWPDIDGVRWLAGNFTDQAVTAAALEGAELVIHLISTSIPKTSNEDPSRDLQNNVGSTLGLLEAIVGLPHQPKIVFISSGGTVYGIPRTIPIPESHPTDPLCAYGIGKLAIEKYLALYQRMHGLDYCILRLANPYGEHQLNHAAQGVIPVFLNKALHNEPLEIWGDGSVIRDYLYIDDVISAIMATTSYNGPDRVFNIGSGSGHSLNDLIELIRELLGRDIPCRYLPARACDVPVNILDVSRARTELGWKPNTPLTAGMARLLEHLGRQP
jgi:UDP-glucose 4-epimerase